MATSAVPPDEPQPTVRPWSLSRLPDYESATAVESVTASALSEAEFRRSYVANLRPLLLKGAVEHWPAFRRWSSSEYLVDKVGAATPVEIRTHPKQEHAQSLDPDPHVVVLRFEEFIRRASTEQSAHLALHSADLKPGDVLQQLQGDVAGMPFLPRIAGSRAYSPYRAFMFGSSFTDWHWHPTDEALLCQIVKPKVVLLLPPDNESWRRMRLIQNRYGATFDRDCSAELSGAPFFRAVVDPGDALYIPVFWWHAVESCGEGLGITVTATFATPLAVNCDFRYAGCRSMLRSVLRTPHAALAMAGVLWSGASRVLPDLLRGTLAAYRNPTPWRSDRH